MELNNITNTGTWSEQATRLNDNFNKVALGIDTLQSAYQSISQSAIEAVDTLPQTGEANKIYRLVGTTSYSDYMYNTDDLTTPILMATYNNAIDNTPTANSANLVTSGGVAKELALGAVYDVSAKNPTAGSNNDGKWESLSALLSDANLNTLIPSSVRKGGMSVKFVQSSDNKYVQYRLMSDTFSITESDWQSMNVDEEPTADSNNLVKSGGTAAKINKNTQDISIISSENILNIKSSESALQLTDVPSSAVMGDNKVHNDANWRYHLYYTQAPVSGYYKVVGKNDPATEATTGKFCIFDTVPAAGEVGVVKASTKDFQRNSNFEKIEFVEQGKYIATGGYYGYTANTFSILLITEYSKKLSDIDDKIEELENEEEFEQYEGVTSTKIEGNTYISPSGVIEAGGWRFSTRYYFCQDKTKIYVKNTPTDGSAMIAVFDSVPALNSVASYVYPETDWQGSAIFEVEANKYVAVTRYNPNVVVMKRAVNNAGDTNLSKVTKNPCNYGGKEASIFNKMVFCGDSTIAAVFDASGGSFTRSIYGIPKYFNKISGVETTALGNGGATSVQWYTTHQNDDLSGYDSAVIQLGINDVQQGVSVEDSITAITNIITKLKNENQNIKIFISTIIPCFYQIIYDPLNNAIRTLADNIEDVFLVDLSKYSQTDIDVANRNGHPTALGYMRLAVDYYAYIGWIIKTNSINFKYVQYANTNHVP